ncbi:MAG: MBL fold metallo-hydrolase, partial [Shimia sp.]|uniref:MBL fold metallo-hydrolase n=1 Tax=Shimia sp. TaxID=1954381 RepID=UPI004058818B
MRRRIPVWADGDTQDDLLSRFGYAFVQPKDSAYPPILELHTIDDADFTISGAGGNITFTPITVKHGRIDALAFRVNDVVYMPDVSEIYDDAWPQLADMKCFIIDALRRSPHPTHAHLDQALEWIEKLTPERAVLTNMHIDLDHSTVDDETPDHITPAFDGMKITYDL